MTECLDRSRVVGTPGFSTTRGRVLVLIWLLVRTLWAVDHWRVVSFFLALLLPAGAAMWVSSGGYVGASDGMVTVSISHVLACRRPRYCSLGARGLCDGG